METLMFSDEELEARDEWRLQRIEDLMQIFAVPQRRQFKPPYGGRRMFPHNKYPEGARFNIGLDVFKITSFRTRGRRPSIVARFDGTLNP